MRNFKMIGLPLIALVLWVVSSTNPVNPEASQKIDLEGLAQTSANGETTGCCIGSSFKIESIPGGWRCLNNQGSSCCPICF